VGGSFVLSPPWFQGACPGLDPGGHRGVMIFSYLFDQAKRVEEKKSLSDLSFCNINDRKSSYMGN